MSLILMLRRRRVVDWKPSSSAPGQGINRPSSKGSLLGEGWDWGVRWEKCEDNIFAEVVLKNYNVKARILKQLKCKSI